MTLFYTSFVAGILTILAPCILPLLPVIIGNSVGSGNKYRALTIAGSLVVTIVLFTFILKVSTAFIGIPNSVWSYVSGVILILLGIITILPKLWSKIPYVGTLYNQSQDTLGSGTLNKSFWGDVLVGASLGPIFSTCSPTYFLILATVLPQSLTQGFFYIITYSIGLALALLSVSLIGQNVLSKLSVNTSDGTPFKKGLGIVVIVVGLLIITGFMKKIEVYLVEQGFGITSYEESLLRDREEDMKKEKRKKGIFSADKKYVEFVSPSGYVNTNDKPVKVGEFVGKEIILLDIMTYSCINCVRTFPYLKSWDDKYRDKGLRIIGIHTPEFAFEKVKKNVENAMKEHGLTFPVILDNEYKTWNALENSYWPRKYLIDINGNVVYDHIGEGDYDITEKKIQDLIRERNVKLGLPDPVFGEISKVKEKEMVGDITHETYLGTDRTENEVPFADKITRNRYAISGSWKRGPESITSTKKDDSLLLHFTSPNVYIVTGGHELIDADIFIDGKFSKKVTLGKGKLVTLFSSNKTETHQMLIKPSEKGAELYAFTFGK